MEAIIFGVSCSHYFAELGLFNEISKKKCLLTLYLMHLIDRRQRSNFLQINITHRLAHDRLISLVILLLREY